MKAVVESKALKAALARVKLVQTAKFGDWSKAVKIEASEGRLALTATNIDTTVTVEIDADALDAEGAAIVQLPVLAAVLPAAGLVSLTGPESGELTVAHRVTHRMEVLDEEEWPKMPVVEVTGQVELTRRMLELVVEAASTDQTRPGLTAVVIRGRNVVATDSYRMHLVQMDEPVDRDVMVPATVVRHLLKAKGVDQFVWQLDEAERRAVGAAEPTKWAINVVVEFDSQFGHERWVTRCIDASVPDFTKISDDLWTAPVLVEMQRPAFDEALRDVSVLALKEKTVPVRIVHDSGGVKLSCILSSQKTQSEATVPGTAPAEVVAFNPRWLMALLASTDATELRGTDQKHPAAVVDELEGRRALRALMPVRVA